MSKLDFENLAFDRAVLNRVDSIGMYVARIPLKRNSANGDFVAVKTDREGNVQRGRIVHMELTQAANPNPNRTSKIVNGVIILRSLHGTEELTSPITNGHITAFHQNATQRTNLEMAPDLPEVVIVGIRHLDSGISFSTWCMVQTFFMDFGGGGSDSWEVITARWMAVAALPVVGVPQEVAITRAGVGHRTIQPI